MLQALPSFLRYSFGCLMFFLWNGRELQAFDFVCCLN
ncbi:hypothetical protein SLEP1_g55921 [Rubroshorea leprosula]|uniref:Uncharacterized protein n=1 Tax=Rubroshorea leprosula TaxID=152421 RepID=A0AAV5MI34_9ROSI|nr:hypothetical protein SLEP1_g55921 [Rubroshorea leprosula]